MKLLKFENELIRQGKNIIAGIDEVGRGPLAGPVVTACVIMPLDRPIEGVFDSKKVSELKRELLYKKIMDAAFDVSFEVVSHTVIDEINILNATKQGMEGCIKKLKLTPDAFLIDAVKIKSDVPTYSIIRGDELSYSIAAASIVAKVYRDRLMCEYAKQYPHYGFEKHKGYGTKLHIENIRQNGLCEIHRRSFCKNFYEQQD